MIILDTDAEMALRTVNSVLNTFETKLNVKRIKGTLIAIETLRDCEELGSKQEAEKSVNIFTKRMSTHNTIQEVADKFQTDKRAVKVIYDKCIKLLRHPSRINLLINGIEDGENTSNKQIYNAARRLDCNINYNTDYLTIEDLNLTARTYNALKRANLLTVNDIKHYLYMYKNFNKIYGLGNKCQKEIDNKLKELKIKIKNTDEEITSFNITLKKNKNTEKIEIVVSHDNKTVLKGNNPSEIINELNKSLMNTYNNLADKTCIEHNDSEDN